MDNAEKIISKIKKERIEPTSPWKFTAKHGILGLGWLLSIIFGAISFSVILYAIQQVDFGIADQLGESGWALVLAMMPIIWLVGILIFITLSILGIKNSKKGYKLEWLKVLNLALVSSMVLGTLVFLLGGAQGLEETFGKQFKGYESINERKIEMWNRPDDGYLAGKIIFSAGDELRLMSFSDEEWTIRYEEAFIAPVLELVKEEEVKVIGTVASNGIFRAAEIRPWGGGPGMKRGAGKGNGRSGGGF